jgi:cyanophycin synthetase
MEVSRIRALRGPNLWTRHSAVEAMVRCENGEIDLSGHPEFESRLRNLFPGLGNLQPSAQKVKLSMAHAVEATTLHLQIEAGCPVTFSRTTATTDEGLFQVAVEYTEEQVGCMAIKLAHEHQL